MINLRKETNRNIQKYKGDQEFRKLTDYFLSLLRTEGPNIRFPKGTKITMIEREDDE